MNSTLHAPLPRLAGPLVALALIATAGGQPAPASPQPPQAPVDSTPSTGLARRPTPKLAERSPSGRSLIPLPAHRKIGTIYHFVRANALTVSAPIAGIRPTPGDVVGYAVARVPLDAGSDGSLGAVLVGGQWMVPWASVLEPATLQSWAKASGGPLQLDMYPDIVVTVRNSLETKQLSKDKTSTTYICTVIADITINGITTERVIPRANLTLARQQAGGIRGDQLSIRAKWKIRLSDFFTTLPDGQVPPNVDVSSDILLSTVAPEFQEGGEPAQPAPQPPAPLQPAPESTPAPEAQSPASPPSEPKEPK